MVNSKIAETIKSLEANTIPYSFEMHLDQLYEFKRSKPKTATETNQLEVIL